ncbi:MAG: HU family DNA-binding protein [Massilibacteroides sp.]|nr:HU family DNA-binding protein [Massilibacteroides sp.]MDD4660591.1 HU family DNA-binding protein [Massilibacteroides sp.]
MGAVKYSIHESPNPQKDSKKTYHARPVGMDTVRIDEIALNISNMSTFSSADIKGVLEALSKVLELNLGHGHTVELEGIGSFSISIASPKGVEEASKINATNIRFKKVNFKCSSKLNKALKSIKFERSEKFRKKKKHTEQERLSRILKYVETTQNLYKGIQSSNCMEINSCSRYMALKDLKTLVASGKLFRQGKKASSLYLPVKQ